MRFGLIALLLLAGTANADVFECQSGTFWAANGKIVVTAIVDPDKGDAYVSVAGISHVADYKVQGFNRRWSFGEETDVGFYRYAFIIHPDDSAAYFDFSSAAEDEVIPVNQQFVCKQTK